jgi:hypothetical protein
MRLPSKSPNPANFENPNSHSNRRNGPFAHTQRSVRAELASFTCIRLLPALPLSLFPDLLCNQTRIRSPGQNSAIRDPRVQQVPKSRKFATLWHFSSASRSFPDFTIAGEFGAFFRIVNPVEGNTSNSQNDPTRRKEMTSAIKIGGRRFKLPMNWMPGSTGVRCSVFRNWPAGVSFLNPTLSRPISKNRTPDPGCIESQA